MLKKFYGKHSLPHLSRAFTSSIDFSSSAFRHDLECFAAKQQTYVQIQHMVDAGLGVHLEQFEKHFKQKISATEQQRIAIQVACFLHRELPVRLAHRACELEAADLFRSSPHVQLVCNGYKQSFHSLRNVPVPTDIAREEMFAKVIAQIYERHGTTLINMARGANEIRNELQKRHPESAGVFIDDADIQQRLDDFYFSRIGIRTLIGQYLAIRSPQHQGFGYSNDPNDNIGLVCMTTSPYRIAQKAIEDSAIICSRTHGDAPIVSIHGRTDLTFPYVPSHVEYILVELLKNSMRATIETHGVDDMPPIKIVIADGEKNEDVVIKVSDEGGGIRRSNMNKIWSYLYTTANPNVLRQMLDGAEGDAKDFSTTSPLAGLGYGLPIARNFARFFGGDLHLMSMEGYGTDGFIYLPRLGNVKV